MAMSELSEGLKKLRLGSLFYLLAFTVSWTSILFMIALGPTATGFMSLALIASLGVFAFLIVFAMALSIASFIYFFMATGALRKANERYGIGRKGMILILVGLILISVSFLMTAILTPATNAMAVVGILVLLLIASAVVILIGVILFGIMLLRLENVDPRFKTAGILYFVGIIVPFLILVAMYFVYSAAGRAMRAQASKV